MKRKIFGFVGFALLMVFLCAVSVMSVSADGNPYLKGGTDSIGISCDDLYIGAPSMTAGELEDACVNTVTVYDQNGAVVSKEQSVATGYTVKMEGYANFFQIICPGDVNGDGMIDGWDYFAVKSHCLGIKSLEGAALQAADVNLDGTVDGWDYFKVKSHCLGISGIFENLLLPMQPHTETMRPGQAPTCTETGLTEGTVCATCGEIIVAQNVLPALGHTYVDGICVRCGAEHFDTASGGLEYSLNSDGMSYSVVGIGDCTDTAIVIPATYNGKSVTGIDDWAFECCTNLTSIEIPNSVTSIGSCAFYDCTSLTSIEIPSSITNIGYGAFGWAELGDGVGLRNIYIIDLEAWLKIEFESGWIWGYWNLYINNEKVEEITLPDDVASVENAFPGCVSLTSIAMPNVTHIGDSAFNGCENLSSVSMPNVKTIGEYAFEHCSKLVNIVIPGSVKNISSGAFSGCASLTNVVISEGVDIIDNSAFSGCTDLTSIVIPKSVTSIGNYAFCNCTALEEIAVAEGNKVYHSANNCLIETKSKILIIGCKNSVIPTDGSVTCIGDYALYKCSGLTSIEIPKCVTSIGNYAFYGCTGLTSVEIPDEVTSIGYAAFCGCTGLTSIEIPARVTSIGSAAFSDCSSLKRITVAEGNSVYHSSGNCLIKTESKTLIVGCNNSIIPADGSVTSIGYSAFSGCTEMTSIVIPESITSIGSYAFDSRTGLDEITYTGTLAQWYDVSKSDSWYPYCYSFTIHCIDGDTVEYYWPPMVG